LVLNNSPRISETTRKKVMDSVRRNDYQPNVHARGLVSRSSMVLSVTVPALDHVFADIYFGEIVSGIYDRASEDGYKILLDIAREGFIQRQEYLSILKSRRADGMLFIASSKADTYLRDFEQESYPFLLVNHYFPGSSLDFLSADYRRCGEMAARHFLDLGHRRIGLIAGLNTYTGIDFRDSFLETCTGNGIPADQIVWVDSEWNEQGGFEAARQILNKAPGLTAIMCANDRMAIGAMRHLLLAGKEIPGDISVMGMDDIEAARFTTPGLTTIRLDLYQIGRKACTRLLGILNDASENCTELIPAKLVPRESTGPSPG
jgi:DNA-binding LacI/PurR family transcriptional regulator